jgi:hypothetical protein
MLPSAESIFFSSNRIELLRKFESIFKTALANMYQGTQGYRLTKITKNPKCRETVPLNCSTQYFQCPFKGHCDGMMTIKIVLNILSHHHYQPFCL